MNMSRYTNTEFADIHFIYGLSNGNGCAIVRLYWQRCPTSRQSTHQVCIRNLVEHGSLRNTIENIRRPRTVQAFIFKENVMHVVEQFPGSNAGAWLRNREISINCPSCITGRSLTSFTCTESAVISAR